MSVQYYWIDVPAGQTVNLREYAETNTNNVITVLPRGTRVIHKSTLSDWRQVQTEDGIIGYIQYRFLSNTYIAPPSGSAWTTRYGSTAWRFSQHYNKYYLAVKNIQTDLKAIGYTKVGTPDGYYGTKTEEAVKEFQSNNSLASDGVFGEMSKSKLWTLSGHN